MKVLLILADGMRPDALGEIPQVREMMQQAAYTLNAKTVMPSVTLPCHMSLFHSVDPSRHGTTTNTYAPQVRPVEGLCEVLKGRKKKCAFFYDWEQLRDLSRPGSLVFSCYKKPGEGGYGESDKYLTDAAIEYLRENDVDFTFLYLGHPDGAGHGSGWMGQEYMDSVAGVWNNIERILATLPEDYAVIITADHGGHDRIHGTELPEDMTIPMFLLGKAFAPGKVLENVSIMDIAPTVTALLGVDADDDWEGKNLL